MKVPARESLLAGDCRRFLRRGKGWPSRLDRSGPKELESAAAPEGGVGDDRRPIILRFLSTFWGLQAVTVGHEASSSV